MNERQRQAYLEVMDIQPFYLKKLLPLAKESPAYDFPDNPVASIVRNRLIDQPSPSEADASGHSAGLGSKASDRASAQKSQSESRRQASLTDLKAELRQPAKSNKAKSEKELAPIDAEAVQSGDARLIEKRIVEGDEEIAFKLRYLHINAELAVIEELPFAHDDSFPPANDDLLKAILLALGVNWEGGDVRSESFIWPIDAGIEYEGDQRSAAKDMLKGFISQRQVANSSANLLVFAGQIESLLSNSTDEHSGHDFDDKATGYHMTLTSTLAAMLAYPMLKKQVWAALQPLRKRLSRSE